MALRAIRAMVRKDLLLFLHDRRAMTMSFAAPILIASFFGFFFSGRTAQTGRVPLRAVDLDGSAVSKALVAGLSRDKSLEVEGGSAEDARAAVRRGDARVAVVIPAGFGEAASRAFLGGADKPLLELMHDPSRSLELAMTRGIVTQHVMQAVSAARFGSVPGGAPTVPFTTREEAVTARSGVAYNGFAHAFAGMGVQFLLFACIDLAVVMLLERQLGLWKRYRAAPLSRFALLTAKATSGALISLMTLGVTFAFGMIVFGIRIQGSLVGFLAVCVATALMAACFGLLIAALGKTPPATRGVATLAVLMMVMLGGAWVPSFVFPPWLQQVTLVVPARWAVDGLDAATWRGVGLLEILPTVGALLGFALLFGGLAVARFRWEAE